MYYKNIEPSFRRSVIPLDETLTSAACEQATIKIVALPPFPSKKNLTPLAYTRHNHNNNRITKIC
jgi:hypothetical protein